MISTAEIIDPSAANTRTWPTRRIIVGASREPARKPRKYPAITSDIWEVGNCSAAPRMPRTVPCMPLPICSSSIPRKSGQAPVTM